MRPCSATEAALGRPATPISFEDWTKFEVRRRQKMTLMQSSIGCGCHGCLYQQRVAPSGDERTVAPHVLPGEERLVPLPAARRRKGLTGISGGRQALLNILEFCRDGVTREELVSHVKTVNPNLKESSIGTQINVIASEFNCLKSDGNRFVLTDRGHAFLESDDPEVLMDWLVTRILGVDHALVILQDETRCSWQELVRRIQEVNPGWTSTWGPQAIIRELRGFDMLDLDDSNFLLSERCRERMGATNSLAAGSAGTASDAVG